MPTDRDTMQDWIHLIKAEYLEMPGLHLTRRQAQRLWMLEPHTCDALLEALVADDFLEKTARETYALAAGVRR